MIINMFITLLCTYIRQILFSDNVMINEMGRHIKQSVSAYKMAGLILVAKVIILRRFFLLFQMLKELKYENISAAFGVGCFFCFFLMKGSLNF